MTREGQQQRWANSVIAAPENPYVLDGNFRPRGWVLGVDAVKGGKAHEWGIEPGEEWGYAYMRALNARHQTQALEQLRRLAAEDKPFYLNYWPQNPVDFGTVNREMTTANGGSWVESMQQLDGWIGELLAEIDRLGIADNTIVVAMGDNGVMIQAIGDTGFTDMIYRGFKGDSLEGGIRVNGFVRWPGVIEEGTIAGDMIHVSDLYTTFARIGGGLEFVPRDRIVDGLDQTALLLNGDGRGRRDYLHVYDGPNLAKTIKQQFKVHWPAPGTPSFKLPVFDLYRDPREMYPLKVQGMWTVAYFGDMRARHMAFKKRFPDRPETRGVPYEGIENLRPETKAMLERYFAAQKLLE
jgi:arylsulfatase